MRKTAEISREHFEGKDELWTRFYTCPKCGQKEIQITFTFCPMCGVKLEWKGEKPND